MSFTDNGPRKRKDDILPLFTPRSRVRLHPLTKVAIFFSTFLLLMEMFGTWPLPTHSVLAATFTPPATATKVSLAQLEQTKGSATKQYYGPLQRPTTVPQTPASTQKKVSAPSAPLPSAEPAKMKAFAYQLDPSFILKQSHAPAQKAGATTKRAQTTLAISAASIPAWYCPSEC